MRVPFERLGEVLKLCRMLSGEGKLKCWSCGAALRYEYVHYYDHGDGYYWVYLQCPYCGYHTALWKIVRY